MNRVFVAFTRDGEVLKTSRRKNTSWFYITLGTAKAAVKSHIKSKNRFLSKEAKLHFEDFKIVEYELIEKETHKL